MTALRISRGFAQTIRDRRTASNGQSADALAQKLGAVEAKFVDARDNRAFSGIATELARMVTAPDASPFFVAACLEVAERVAQLASQPVGGRAQTLADWAECVRYVQQNVMRAVGPDAADMAVPLLDAPAARVRTLALALWGGPGFTGVAQRTTHSFDAGARAALVVLARQPDDTGFRRVTSYLESARSRPRKGTSRATTSASVPLSAEDIRAIADGTSPLWALGAIEKAAGGEIGYCDESRRAPLAAGASPPADVAAFRRLVAALTRACGGVAGRHADTFIRAVEETLRYAQTNVRERAGAKFWENKAALLEQIADVVDGTFSRSNGRRVRKDGFKTAAEQALLPALLNAAPHDVDAIRASIQHAKSAETARNVAEQAIAPPASGIHLRIALRDRSKGAAAPYVHTGSFNDRPLAT